MAQATIPMNAEMRIPGTKNDARRLRAAGHVPGTLYGSKQKALSLSLEPKPLLAVMHTVGGHNRILNITVKDGETSSAVLKDWLVDPVSDKLLHVDLQRIDLTKKLRAKVPVHAVGEAKGVKVQGGILEFVLREVEVECLPLEIPDSIDADVTELVLGKNLRVRDLVIDSNITMVSGADQVVAHVTIVKEEEVKPAEEVAAAATGPAEPEVIKKGKKDEEGAEEAPAKGGKAEPKGEKKK